jgi:hypothetical protein
MSPRKPAAYKPHRDDPKALRRKCPDCGAKVGFWCSGGIGDIHRGRLTVLERKAQDLVARKALKKALHEAGQKE